VYSKIDFWLYRLDGVSPTPDVIDAVLAGYRVADPAVRTGVREVFGERYHFSLVFAEAQPPAFADVRLVDRVKRDEVGQVAYPIVIRVLNGMKRDAVLAVHGADCYPPDGGLAVDLGAAKELLDAVPAAQGSYGELPGEVTHPESVVPSGLTVDQPASRTRFRSKSKAARPYICR
jgi:hypothetical protein